MTTVKLVLLVIGSNTIVKKNVRSHSDQTKISLNSSCYRVRKIHWHFLLSRVSH